MLNLDFYFKEGRKVLFLDKSGTVITRKGQFKLLEENGRELKLLEVEGALFKLDYSESVWGTKYLIIPSEQETCELIALKQWQKSVLTGDAICSDLSKHVMSKFEVGRILEFNGLCASRSFYCGKDVLGRLYFEDVEDEEIILMTDSSMAWLGTLGEFVNVKFTDAEVNFFVNNFTTLFKECISNGRIDISEAYVKEPEILKIATYAVNATPARLKFGENALEIMALRQSDIDIDRIPY